MLPHEEGYYVAKMRRLHLSFRTHVMGATRQQDPATLAQVAREAPEDTIFYLDEGVEDILVEFCEEWGRETPFILVAEGLEGGRRVFPAGFPAGDADFLLIIDPIDGTRPLMYDKRSGWVLSAVAENRGGEATARDIVVAMQTELPTTRQYLAAHLWAIAGQGHWAETHDVLNGTVQANRLKPSQATTLENGYGGLVKFFPEGKSEAAALEQELFDRVGAGNRVFDDQYISTGGQLYELMTGHDRFLADIRPVLLDGGLCTHPYDLCTELIAREAGTIVTRLDGEPLDFPLDVTTPVGWTGYANATLRDLIQPELERLLASR